MCHLLFKPSQTGATDLADLLLEQLDLSQGRNRKKNKMVLEPNHTVILSKDL
jgi:hypothetical protein